MPGSSPPSPESKPKQEEGTMSDYASMKKREECGTRRGRKIHKENGEPMCEACIDFRRQVNAYRATPVMRAKRIADGRVKSELKRRHMSEYQTLYNDIYRETLREMREKMVGKK